MKEVLSRIALLLSFVCTSPLKLVLSCHPPRYYLGETTLPGKDKGMHSLHSFFKWLDELYSQCIKTYIVAKKIPLYSEQGEEQGIKYLDFPPQFSEHASIVLCTEQMLHLSY